MIPYQAALAGWIPIAFLLMLDKNHARGFSLAMLGALLFLPAREYPLHIPVIPNLGRANAAGVGILLGTLVFHPHLLTRFRFRFSDALLGGTLVCIVLSSVYNHFGLYDGLSVALGQTVDFILPLVLARIHLNSPLALQTFLVSLVWASVAYTPLAVWEWRMSPQIHTTLYGFFQHVFIQHARGGFWRPIVCFSHALALGRFFAFTAFLAAFPLRNLLARQINFGGLLFLAPLLGLLVSMSWGPYLLFVLLAGLYFVCRRWSFAAYAAPAAAFLWLFLVFMGAKPFYGIVNSVAQLNPARAESLQYRLNALDEYRDRILDRPLLGHAGWSQGRITGLATDSAVLVHSLSRGLLGAAFLYLWWFWTMHVALRVARRLRNTTVGPPALGVATFLPLCIAVSVIDSALDYHIVLPAAGILTIDRLVRATRVVPLEVLERVPEPEPVVPHRPPRAARMTLRARKAAQERARRMR